jgi:hypothetical protein
MHDVVIDGLERHLSGGAVPAFYAHLEACPECRSGIAEMESVSALFAEFRAGEGTIAGIAPEPRLGFYSRVATRIVDDQRREAWGLFSPGAVFFRRIAFASLLLLAGLGSFLVSREASFTDSQDAVAIMAEHDAGSSHPETADRDRMMVTLANYRE